MQGLALEGSRDWQVRRAAVSALERYQASEHDMGAALSALHRFCRDRIRFVPDPTGSQMVQSPRATLELRAGNCVQKATLLAAMARSIGIPVSFRVIAANPRYPESFSHVYVVGNIHGRELVLDPTYRSNEPGFEYPKHTRRGDFAMIQKLPASSSVRRRPGWRTPDQVSVSGVTMSGYGDGCSSDCVQTMGFLPAVPVVASAASGAINVIGGAISSVGTALKGLFGSGGPTVCPVASVDDAVRIIWPLRNNPAAAEKALDGCRKDPRSTALQLMPQAWGIVNDNMARGTVPSQVTSINVPGFSVPLPSANNSALLLGVAVLGGIMLLSRRRSRS
jgi:hypothetical protein